MLWNWKLTDEIELQMHFLLCVFVDQWVECALCIILKKKLEKLRKWKKKIANEAEKDVLFSKIYLLQFVESLPPLIPFGFCENIIILIFFLDSKTYTICWKFLCNLLKILIQFP